MARQRAPSTVTSSRPVSTEIAFMSHRVSEHAFVPGELLGDVECCSSSYVTISLFSLRCCRSSSAEVLQGSYGPKCDMWSMGVIAYMMVSGAPPFWGNGDAQVGYVLVVPLNRGSTYDTMPSDSTAVVAIIRYFYVFGRTVRSRRRVSRTVLVIELLGVAYHLALLYPLPCGRSAPRSCAESTTCPTCCSSTCLPMRRTSSPSCSSSIRRSA